MTNIIIIGNYIAAEIMYGYFQADERYKVVCFSVDEEYITEEEKFGLKIINLKKLKENYNPKDYKIIIGVGYNNINQNRENIFNRVKEMGYEIETYIHPSAVVNETASIGEGSMILSNSVVEPFVKVGENSIIWSNCTLAHHSEVESHCWIASNSILSGQAKIKHNTFIGVNCTIVNEVIVERMNIIGAGSLITKNTNEQEVYLSRSAEKHRFDSVNYSKYFLK